MHEDPPTSIIIPDEFGADDPAGGTGRSMGVFGAPGVGEILIDIPVDLTPAAAGVIIIKCGSERLTAGIITDGDHLLFNDQDRGCTALMRFGTEFVDHAVPADILTVTGNRCRTKDGIT